jgi:hypothetical protein
MQFKEKRVLTLPTMKFENNTTRYFRFDSKIEIKPKTELEKNKETGAMEEVEKEIAVVMVTDLEEKDTDKQRGQLVVGTVLQSVMNESYPEGDYVEKCFKIEKDKQQGRRYATYTVIEIEVDAEDE